MHRKIVSHLVVLALGMAMGLGAVAVAQSQTASPAQSKVDRQIVRQLKDINTKLGFNFKKNSLVGLTFDGFSDLHRDIVQSCIALNRSLGGTSFDCPSFIR
jgi:hypothetical protein